MSDYDFSSLNDKDFEVLVVDLLTHHLNLHIERFKPGTDQGIDGRFFETEDNASIIQCKHWLKSGVTKLLNQLSKTESSKVTKLSPARYMLVTSLPLSAHNKTKIREIFSPYIRRDDDVLGQEDLNSLLKIYPEVERIHYKLWISSTNVLQTILNSGIIGRSRAKMEEITHSSSTFVETKAFYDAKKRLEERHTVIISGSPGIGKTFLAEHLCQYYAAHDYEFCMIEHSLSEADDIYNAKSKQIFYYDDFLGRNFLEALGHHQDSHVLNFIKKVSKDPKKRFVLTSRTNILNRGKSLSDLFEIEKIDRNEYQIQIGGLNLFDRAKILYNHIWFGDLEEGYIEEIYVDKRYQKIIKHPNFNPRLISFVTDSQRLDDIDDANYWSYVEHTLSFPQNIWSNLFQVQLDDFSRSIVLAVCLTESAIEERVLAEFSSRIKLEDSSISKAASFDDTIKQLVGSLLNRNLSKDKVTYSLYNPSIADYAITHYLCDSSYLNFLLYCLQTPNSIRYFRDLSKSGRLESLQKDEVMQYQLKRLFGKHGTTETQETITAWLIVLSDLSTCPASLENEVREYAQIILELGHANVALLELVVWLLRTGLVGAKDRKVEASFLRWLNDAFSQIEFELLAEILNIIGSTNISLANEFRPLFIEYISEQLTSEAIETDEFPGIYESYEFNERSFESLLIGRFKLVGLEPTEDEMELIYDQFNIEDIIQYNRDASSEDDSEFERIREDREILSNEMDAIDDLFNRG